MNSSMEKIIFSNLNLIGFNRECDEVKKSGVNFHELMFQHVNVKGFQIIIRFLLAVLDQKKCSLLFKDCWPITDKKSLSQFNNSIYNWLKCVHREVPDAYLPTIVPSLFQNPGGRKFLEFLLAFSRYILQLKISRDLLKESHTFMKLNFESRLPNILYSSYEFQTRNLLKSYFSIKRTYELLIEKQKKDVNFYVEKLSAIRKKLDETLEKYQLAKSRYLREVDLTCDSNLESLNQELHTRVNQIRRKRKLIRDLLTQDGITWEVVSSISSKVQSGSKLSGKLALLDSEDKILRSIICENDLILAGKTASPTIISFIQIFVHVFKAYVNKIKYENLHNLPLKDIKEEIILQDVQLSALNSTKHEITDALTKFKHEINDLELNFKEVDFSLLGKRYNLHEEDQEDKQMLASFPLSNVKVFQDKICSDKCNNVDTDLQIKTNFEYSNLLEKSVAFVASTPLYASDVNFEFSKCRTNDSINKTIDCTYLSIELNNIPLKRKEKEITTFSQASTISLEQTLVHNNRNVLEFENESNVLEKNLENNDTLFCDLKKKDIDTTTLHCDSNSVTYRSENNMMLSNLENSCNTTDLIGKLSEQEFNGAELAKKSFKTSEEFQPLADQLASLIIKDENDHSSLEIFNNPLDIFNQNAFETKNILDISDNKLNIWSNNTCFDYYLNCNDENKKIIAKENQHFKNSHEEFAAESEFQHLENNSGIFSLPSQISLVSDSLDNSFNCEILETIDVTKKNTSGGFSSDSEIFSLPSQISLVSGASDKNSVSSIFENDTNKYNFDLLKSVNKFKKFSLEEDLMSPSPNHKPTFENNKIEESDLVSKVQHKKFKLDSFFLK